MKKFIAMFAVLAASTLAQAQAPADHPNARNDRMPSASVAEPAHAHNYPRADHRGSKKHHHRKHHRKHHHKM
jgi:hypothetical protein